MHVTQRRAVSEQARAWLDTQLPRAEFLVSTVDRARQVLEVEQGDELVGCAIVVEGAGTLSGAPVLVALLADTASARRELQLAMVDLATEAGSLELLGPDDVAGRMAEDLAHRIGGVATTVMQQQLLWCREVRIPAQVPGRMRGANAGDTVQLARWFDAFSVEALHAPPRGGASWEQLVGEASGELYVWEVGGQRTAMVRARRTTRCSHRLGSVYTPPEHRRNGYASALTAHVTRNLLTGGDLQVVLLTDVSNPTSNNIYRTIGYELVDDHSSWIVRGMR